MRTASILVCVVLSTTLSAQSNSVAGLDGATSRAESLTSFGRRGAFPNGTNGCAMLTQSCNPGSVNIWFFAAMDPRHPLISSLVCRQSDGRFVQISNRSHVKHAFLSTNSGGCG